MTHKQALFVTYPSHLCRLSSGSFSSAQQQPWSGGNLVEGGWCQSSPHHPSFLHYRCSCHSHHRDQGCSCSHPLPAKAEHSQVVVSSHKNRMDERNLTSLLAANSGTIRNIRVLLDFVIFSIRPLQTVLSAKLCFAM